MEQVPVRDLRNYTADVLARVKAGEIVEITEWGKPVARLVPLDVSGWDQLQALGWIHEATEKGRAIDLKPLDPIPGQPLPSEVLAKQRARER